MAFDTTIDNEGIKKGLGLVVSQLIQSNKKLNDLNEPNLLKLKSATGDGKISKELILCKVSEQPLPVLKAKSVIVYWPELS